MVKRSWRNFLSGVALLGGLAVANTAFAGDGCTAGGSGCGTGVACTDCHECEKIFADAGQKLTDQLASMSCCGPAAAGCCAPASVCDDGCADPCGDIIADGCGDGCGEGCGNLFGESGNGIEIGGWTQFGYQNKADGAFTGNGAFNNVNFGGGFSNATEWGKFNLNQQGLYIGKTADGSNGVGLGFRAEVIYGVDGNEAQSFGNNPGRWDFANGFDHGTYEWALPQMYAEVAMGDLSIKAGHFYTTVGYEVIPSYGNFFLSRQLTFYNSEPFTHTGVLATYKASDNLQILGGWSAGWDTGFDRFANGSNLLTGLIYTLSDTASFTYMAAYGDFGARGSGAINSFIVTNNWSDKLTSIHQLDVLGTDANNGGADFQTTGVADNSTGQINYLLYTLTDEIKAGVRQEWYKADGTSYNTMTYGFNITPMENLVVRPEIRHMWAPGANNSAAAPGHDTLFNSTVFGIDAVVTY